MLFKRLLTIVLPLASALPWDGPQVTATVDLGSFELFTHDQIGIAAKPGWNPVPTAKPRGFDEGDELWKRVSSAAFTSSTIYDTCGFLEGSVAFPQTCDAGYTCAIATAQNVWACCPTPSACQIATTCVPQSALVSCAGNAACQGNNYATKCDTFDPYCNQQIIIGQGNLPATLFYCDSIPSIETIYATATDGGTSAGASFVYVSMTIASVSVSPTPTPSSSSTPIPTPTIFTSTSSSPPVPTQSSKSTPIGAIVGGTIGGVAVLIAVAFGVFFLMRSKKKNNAAPASDMQQAQYHPQAGPGVGEGTPGYVSPQPGSKEYYSTHGSPVSPYSPPGSPPIGPPAPQYQPNYNYQHGPSEVEGTAIHR